MNQTDIIDIDSLVDEMRGLRIVGGGVEGESGIHLELSDGRYLVIEGQFIVGLARVRRQEIH